MDKTVRGTTSKNERAVKVVGGKYRRGYGVLVKETPKMCVVHFKSGDVEVRIMKENVEMLLEEAHADEAS